MTDRRVVRHLLDAGKIAREQLEEAERMRGFFGGLLETHLLKLGHVDEATLASALTEVSGVPYATGEHLRAIPEDALRALPQALVEKHRVCPFRIEDRRLQIAMLDPRDRIAIADLQSATAYVIEPWITTEFRLYQALERSFRIRFEGVKAISLAPPSLPRPRGALGGVPTAGVPAGPEIGLDGLPLDADTTMALDPYAHGSGSSRVLEDADPPAPPPPAASVIAPAPAPEPSARYGDLDDALAAARDRDGVAEALLDFCVRRASRAALFAVGREGVRGVAGRGRGFDTAAVRRVELPLRSGTVFDTALGSRDFYFGVVPALPPNRDLYTALGGRIPAMVMIVPVVMKERTAALIYLDGDDAPLLHPDIPLMRRVAAKAGIAFELVLLRSKMRAI